MAGPGNGPGGAGVSDVGTGRSFQGADSRASDMQRHEDAMRLQDYEAALQAVARMCVNQKPLVKILRMVQDTLGKAYND